MLYWKGFKYKKNGLNQEIFLAIRLLSYYWKRNKDQQVSKTLDHYLISQGLWVQRMKLLLTYPL